MMSISAMNYFMDDPREAERLREKVDAGAWVEKYLAPVLKDARQVLEVGCGLGALAGEVTRQHSHLHVTGLDLSAERLEAAQAQGFKNATFEQGSAMALPFEGDRFDVVYTRFLLEYLAGRQQAVNEMVRVCRPGGRVLLQDLDGQLLWHYPPDEQLEEGIAQVLKFLESTGFDPFVGRKLFSLARHSGLQNIMVQAESYHLFAGPIDEHNLHLWDLKLDIALQAGAKVLGENAALKLKQRFLDYLQRDDTLTYSVVFTVVGTKPN